MANGKKPINGRRKGIKGEREIIDLLQPIVSEVYGSMGLDAPELQRNLQQAYRSGGFDIRGLDWFAPEVKRAEQQTIESWWQQCLGQAKPGQEPVLLYRKSKQVWQARLIVRMPWCGRWIEAAATVDIESFLAWFRSRLVLELSK